MKRVLVFTLLGPALAVVMALSDDVAHGGLNIWIFLIGEVVLAYSMFVSAVAGVVDYVLACRLPVAARAPLIAICGAIVAAGPVLTVGLPQGVSIASAIVGAICSGLCSLLSHDYRRASP